MIARLQGAVASRGDKWVILDVHDVGYMVHCSDRTLARLPVQGTTVVLYVETTVRTDAITLYGFFDHTERKLFRLLTTVQGVGARVALQLLSALAPEQLAQALATQNKAILTSIHGINTRIATRLITELHNKVDKIAHNNKNYNFSVFSPPSVTVDAVSALINLGFPRAEAHVMVAHAEDTLEREIPQVSPDLGMILRVALRARAVQKKGE